MPSFWDDRRQYPRPVGRPGHLLIESEGDWWVRLRKRSGEEGWAVLSGEAILPLGWPRGPCGNT
jgi:hypothetical protein